MSDWLDGQNPEKVLAALDRLRSTSSGARYITEVAGGDVRFAVWLKLIDGNLVRRVGLTHRDLEDHCWRDLFDDGLSPKDALEEALAEDDLIGGLL